MSAQIAVVFAASSQALLTALVASIGLGSVYALVALSFTLVHSATGYFHLGMGAFVTLGAVGAYTGVVDHGWPWLVTASIVVVIGAAMGVLSEFVAVRPVRGRAADDHYAVIVSTLAFMIVADSLIELWFGTDALRVPAYADGPPVVIGGVPVRRVFIVMTAVLVVVAAGLEYVMRRTETGRILRAAQDDALGVELLGISFRRVVVITFGAAGAFAALAGVLISPISYASAFVGADLLLYGFAAMAIGGFGSFAGALAGAYVVGVVVSFAPLYLEPQFTRPVLLGAVLVLLLGKPAGLLGRGALRHV